MQDMKENMFAETEPAQALKEIRSRDPAFDMVRFLYHLKVDVPIVIQAYLRGQVDVLKQHCSPDMLERLQGIIAAQQAQVGSLHKLNCPHVPSKPCCSQVLTDSRIVESALQHPRLALSQSKLV